MTLPEYDGTNAPKLRNCKQKKQKHTYKRIALIKKKNSCTHITARRRPVASAVTESSCIIVTDLAVSAM